MEGNHIRTYKVLWRSKGIIWSWDLQRFVIKGEPGNQIVASVHFCCFVSDLLYLVLVNQIVSPAISIYAFFAVLPLFQLSCECHPSAIRQPKDPALTNDSCVFELFSYQRSRLHCASYADITLQRYRSFRKKQNCISRDACRTVDIFIHFQQLSSMSLNIQKICGWFGLWSSGTI